MRLSPQAVFAALLVAFMPLQIAAAPTDAIDSYLRSLTAKGQFSGNVLVAVNDRIVFQRSYGYANYELHVRNTPATRFRIFSITKQFVAATIMSLAQQKRLAVSDPVARYVPTWPSEWSAVTIRELLNHSAGFAGSTELRARKKITNLENVWAVHDAATAGPISECDNLRAISGELPKVPLLHRPGTTWDYSNFGYDVLGCIVEHVSGMRLAEAFATYVAQPAGMHDTGFVGRPLKPDPQYVGNPATVDNLATAYDGIDGLAADRQQAMPLQYASAGAGDIYTTAADMFAYSKALYSGRVLNRQSQAEMLSESVPVREGAAWGLGWEVFTASGHRFMEHTGSNNGFSASFTRFPEERATIVMLTNLENTDVHAIRERIADLLFHGKYALPKSS